MRASNFTVEVWGNGTAYREFLHVDDLAKACLFLMNFPKDELAAKVRPMESHLNIGIGKELTIKELALLLKEISGFEGSLSRDLSKPNDTPKKLLDTKLINSLGWQAKTDLKQGLTETYS